MSPILSLVLSALLQIASNTAEAATITSVITMLEQIIASGTQIVEGVLPMIKNIIAALKSNAALTPDMMAQLAALDATTDADFEDAAKTAGASPDPNAP